MTVSLKYYTLKYLITILLVIIAIWAGLFYAFILDEVYDNTDDGLKNLKIQIIREAYQDEEILNVREFGLNQFKITPINLSEYKEGNFFRNELYYMEYDEDMEPYRVLETYFTDRNGNNHKLEIKTSTVEEDDFRENLFIALVILYVFLVISIVFINHIVLRKVWKPFYKTLSNLDKYELGKAQNLNDISTDVREFQLLDRQINKMIERNEQTFYQQKQFIENASHELQTPLAIAINKLDLLFEEEELSEKSMMELIQTKEGLMRLVRLNKSLLMLSKIENNQFAEKQEVNLNNIIKTVAEDLTDMIEFKNITLDITQTGIFTTIINSDLAYITISNLLRNAIKYNRSNGKIIIEISNNTLQIKNTSNFNQPLDKTLIFSRFYKQNQDNSSTGLGLSIVDAVISNHSELRIDYYFQNNFHIFTMKSRNS